MKKDLPNQFDNQTNWRFYIHGGQNKDEASLGMIYIVNGTT